MRLNRTGKDTDLLVRLILHFPVWTPGHLVLPQPSHYPSSGWPSPTVLSADLQHHFPTLSSDYLPRWGTAYFWESWNTYKRISVDSPTTFAPTGINVATSLPVTAFELCWGQSCRKVSSCTLSVGSFCLSPTQDLCFTSSPLFAAPTALPALQGHIH